MKGWYFGYPSRLIYDAFEYCGIFSDYEIETLMPRCVGLFNDYRLQWKRLDKEARTEIENSEEGWMNLNDALSEFLGCLE